MVSEGPAIEKSEAKIETPVCIRMIGGLQTYNIGLDEPLTTPEPICRIDVALRGSDGLVIQRGIDLVCKRPEGQSTRVLQYLEEGTAPFLYEPTTKSTSGIRGISMQVDKTELIAKLRALADGIEKLP